MPWGYTFPRVQNDLRTSQTAVHSLVYISEYTVLSSFGTVLTMFGTVWHCFDHVWHCLDPEFSIWDLEFSIWDLEFSIWDPGYGCLDPGYGCLDPGYGCLGMGMCMGWALAIPDGCTGSTPPVYPPCLHHPGYTSAARTGM